MGTNLSTYLGVIVQHGIPIAGQCFLSGGGVPTVFTVIILLVARVSMYI